MRSIPLFTLVLVACGGGTNSSSTLNDALAVDSSNPGSDAAPDGSTTARDPALDGDATVTTATAAIPGATAQRTLAATVFTPSIAGPRPLVVISPGFQLQRTQYTSYARHLATWGFVVVLTDYAAGGGLFPNHTTLATDVPAVVDWALAQTSLAIDPQKIALAGHSLGGKISVYAASLDPRIKAVVGWDPVDSSNPSVAPEKMASLTAAIAVVGETTNGGGGGMPCAPTADNFNTFYGAAPSPALAVTVTGADHMDWVDDSSCGVCGFCSPGAAPAERARLVTKRVDVAWLRRYLLGDLAMDAWLDVPPELAAGLVSIARR